MLIVEDGDELREVTRRVLTGAGFDVLAVATGREAIELASRAGEPADLLLTDMIMPGMTGDQVAITIRELWPDVRVLFMSGYAGPVFAGGVHLQLNHPLLTKPFMTSDLISKILEVFAQPPVRVGTRGRPSPVNSGD